MKTFRCTACNTEAISLWAKLTATRSSPARCPSCGAYVYAFSHALYWTEIAYITIGTYATLFICMRYGTFIPAVAFVATIVGFEMVRIFCVPLKQGEPPQGEMHDPASPDPHR